MITLAGITGLNLADLSANVGRICAPVSLFIPAYLVMVMGGLAALRGVLPAVTICGIAFASTQFLVSSFMGPRLTEPGIVRRDGIARRLLMFWKPSDDSSVRGSTGRRRALEQEPRLCSPVRADRSRLQRSNGTAQAKFWWRGLLTLLLVFFVVLFGLDYVKQATAPTVITVQVAGSAQCRANGRSRREVCFSVSRRLHTEPRNRFGYRSNVVLHLRGFDPSDVDWSVPSVCWRGCEAACIADTDDLLRARNGVPDELLGYDGDTRAGVCGDWGLFPFFSSLLGWLGVFLTGSDTSANALFGNLQVVTASRLNLNPVLMAAANSSGGVMGKMISLQSIAVAAAATGMPSSDESKLFRFTLRHSIFLACVLGLITLDLRVRRPDTGALKRVGGCCSGFDRKPGLGVRSPSTVQRNRVFVAHLLEVIGNKSRTKAAATIQNQFGVVVRNLSLDIALDDALA